MSEFDILAALDEFELNQNPIDNLLHHKPDFQALRIIVSNVGEASIDFWIDFLEELYGGSVVGYCYEYVDIHGASVGNSLSK